MTLAEYEKLNNQAVEIEEKRKHEEWKYNVDNADEIAAKFKREKYKEIRLQKEQKKDKKKKKEEEEPQTFAAPDEIGSIGGWKAVEER